MHPAGALVGRENESALLRGLLRELGRGSGNAVLIEGEPGIGKSALTRAALAAAKRECDVPCQLFWGAGDELGQELPLLPFLDALRVRAPSAHARRRAIAGLLRGEVATDRGTDVPALLAEQLIALTIDEAAACPVVLVIDDLQWADRDTVRLWGRLARTAREVSLLLVGLTRPVPHREDVAALRRAVNDAARIRLGTLPEPAVAKLVGVLAEGRPDAGLLRLAAGAAGNPLYLTELIAALRRSGTITITAAGTATLADGTVPDSLPAAIADRLGFVSPATREVLQAAALLGVEFAVTDLSAVLGKTVSDLVPVLGEAHEMGVLSDARGGTTLTFRHPLIREALYAEMSAGVRGAWHREAAHALAEAGAPPDRVARQLLRAAGGRGDGGSAAQGTVGKPGGQSVPGTPAIEIERPPLGADRPWVVASASENAATAASASGAAASGAAQADPWLLNWLTGAADALVGQAPAVAAELLRQAVAGMPAGSDRHGWLASRLADAFYRTGDRASAERVARRALGYATDPDLIVDLHWTLAQCRMLSGSVEESFAALERAITAPGITPKHRGRLLVLSARTYLYLGNIEAAGREANTALGSAAEADDTWATGWALHVLALRAMIRGDLTDALPLYERALTVTETDPALHDLGLLLQINKAVTLFNLDRSADALATAEHARQLADQAGTAIRVAQAHGVLGQSLHEIGRWDDALAELSAVPTDLKEAGAASGELGVMAMIEFHRNDPAEARRQLADAEELAGRVDQPALPALLLARSLDREQAGRLPEALAVLTAAIDDSPDAGEVEDLLVDAARLAVKTGEKTVAQSFTATADTLAAGSVIPHRQAAGLYCRGLVDRDSDVLLAAARRFAEAGRPLPRAKALEAAAEVLVEADERALARQAFEQAVEVYERLGAEADLNRVQAEFRGYGIRRGPHSKHRRATSGWEALTDAELKVAAFVADGLSNPDIADRLTLSRRTVATHVSHILKKLNVATRTDIAREWARRGPQAE